MKVFLTLITIYFVCSAAFWSLVTVEVWRGASQLIQILPAILTAAVTAIFSITGLILFRSLDKAKDYGRRSLIVGSLTSFIVYLGLLLGIVMQAGMIAFTRTAAVFSPPIIIGLIGLIVGLRYDFLETRENRKKGAA